MPDEQIAALERQHAHLRSQFASIGEMRSGSLTERFRPCGKAWCHCAKPGDPGHGPVLSLTRKRAGKTVTRIIPAQAGPETQARLAELGNETSRHSQDGGAHRGLGRLEVAQRLRRVGRNDVVARGDPHDGGGRRPSQLQTLMIGAPLTPTS